MANPTTSAAWRNRIKLLDLPVEIQTMIYKFALGTYWAIEAKRYYYHKQDVTARFILKGVPPEAKSLISTCRQICQIIQAVIEKIYATFDLTPRIFLPVANVLQQMNAGPLNVFAKAVKEVCISERQYPIERVQIGDFKDIFTNLRKLVYVKGIQHRTSYRGGDPGMVVNILNGPRADTEALNDVTESFNRYRSFHDRNGVEVEVLHQSIMTFRRLGKWLRVRHT